MRPAITRADLGQVVPTSAVRVDETVGDAAAEQQVERRCTTTKAELANDFSEDLNDPCATWFAI
ncbi:hypothetical protein [Mesorhizobium sp. M0011]|uniref:hypothetical protein n=1 Tax=Mesorhizobium sp. M0011 TaxID=2956839 RepID=UPI003337C844